MHTPCSAETCSGTQCTRENVCVAAPDMLTCSNAGGRKRLDIDESSGACAALWRQGRFLTDPGVVQKTVAEALRTGPEHVADWVHSRRSKQNPLCRMTPR